MCCMNLCCWWQTSMESLSLITGLKDEECFVGLISTRWSDEHNESAQGRTGLNSGRETSVWNPTVSCSLVWKQPQHHVLGAWIKWIYKKIPNMKPGPSRLESEMESDSGELLACTHGETTESSESPKIPPKYVFFKEVFPRLLFILAFNCLLLD